MGSCASNISINFKFLLKLVLKLELILAFSEYFSAKLLHASRADIAIPT